MTLDLENDETLSAAIEGLPRVIELITTVPEEKRQLALAAAHQSYLQTAQTLGYEEPDAREWASTIMSMLEIASLASERATQERSPQSSSQPHDVSANDQCQLDENRSVSEECAAD